MWIGENLRWRIILVLAFLRTSCDVDTLNALLLLILQQIQLVYAPIIEFKLLLTTCQSLSLFPLLPTDLTSTTSPQSQQRLIRSPADGVFVGKCFADRIYCSAIFIGNDVILTQELLSFLEG